MILVSLEGTPHTTTRGGHRNNKKNPEAARKRVFSLGQFRHYLCKYFFFLAEEFCVNTFSTTLCRRGTHFPIDFVILDRSRVASKNPPARATTP